MMRRVRGFTLIELMVVVVIVAILAAIAVPAFTGQMRKSRRADAARGLSELQLREERWRASHANYVGTDTSAANLTLFGALPTSDYYTFAFDSVESGTGFTVKATAKGVQAGDTACATMKIQVAASVVTKTPTTDRCWN
jgi:type IV pilus assembly protein PilE